MRSEILRDVNSYKFEYSLVLWLILEPFSLSRLVAYMRLTPKLNKQYFLSLI